MHIEIGIADARSLLRRGCPAKTALRICCERHQAGSGWSRGSVNAFGISSVSFERSRVVKILIRGS
jgi:hypothetical protein